jgi:hypothetical protein
MEAKRGGNAISSAGQVRKGRACVAGLRRSELRGGVRTLRQREFVSLQAALKNGASQFLIEPAGQRSVGCPFMEGELE